MDDKQDELSIDFGKIKKLFTKKQPATQEGASKAEPATALSNKTPGEQAPQDKPSSQQASDNPAGDELGFNLSNAAKSASKVFGSKEGKAESELNIDFKKIWNVIVRYKLFFLLIIPLLLSMDVRTGNLDLPIADQWAQDTITNYLRADISGVVAQQYPNLPANVRDNLVQEELTKALASQQYTFKTGQFRGQVVNLEQQRKSTAQQFRSQFQYESGGNSYVYMPDIDPYTYLRWARNIVETGHQYDELRDGKPIDNHMFAPIGREHSSKVHASVLAFQHKLFSIFNPDIPLMQSAGYFPVVMVALATIPAFFLGSLIAGPLGGFISAVTLAISPAALGRTIWGHADTDAYTLVFPLFIVWAFYLTLNADTLKKKAIYGGLLGLLLGMFSRAWSGGWWYLLDFLVATIGIYLIYLAGRYWLSHKTVHWKSFLRRDKVKNSLYTLGLLIGTSAIFVTVFSNFKAFYRAFSNPVDFLTIKAASKVSIWPNVYTTVAELNSANWDSIIGSLGGKVLLYVAVFGLLLTLLIKDKEKRFDPKYFILLSIWFGATIFAATKGIRFTMLLVPAFSLAFGAAIGLTYRFLVPWMREQLNIPKAATIAIIIGIAWLLLLDPLRAAYIAPTRDVPIVNDAWYNALTKIREDSQPNAIINSWWDFGHHFKYFADRAVTFDGASQNTPMAHWIGKTLLTANESQAIGILRMLDCGSYTGVEALEEALGGDTLQAVNTAYTIIEQDNEEARETLLQAGINEADTQAILEKTHCTPPEDYFIASHDMISKSGVWAHFGSWDFEKAVIWKELRKLSQGAAVQAMQERFGYTEERARQLYNEAKSLKDEGEANTWIAPWPSYATAPQQCAIQGDMAQCATMRINLSSYEAQVSIQQIGVVQPHSLIYIDERGEFTQKVFPDGQPEVSISLIPTGRNSYAALMSSPSIATSMFNRMFFYDGHGLEHFKALTVETQPSGGKIYVYKVDWDGSEPTVMPSLENRDSVLDGDDIQVDYIGYFPNGTIFDTSIKGWREGALPELDADASFDEQESEPISFTAGAGTVVPGFDKGVIGMRLGEEKVLTLEPQDAYGTDPALHPLANQTLKFKIRIAGIEGLTLPEAADQTTADAAMETAGEGDQQANQSNQSTEKERGTEQ